jgi:hypothetical protein
MISSVETVANIAQTGPARTACSHKLKGLQALSENAQRLDAVRRFRS